MEFNKEQYIALQLTNNKLYETDSYKSLIRNVLGKRRTWTEENMIHVTIGVAEWVIENELLIDLCLTEDIRDDLSGIATIILNKIKTEYIRPIKTK